MVKSDWAINLCDFRFNVNFLNRAETIYNWLFGIFESVFSSWQLSKQVQEDFLARVLKVVSYCCLPGVERKWLAQSYPTCFVPKAEFMISRCLASDLLTLYQLMLFNINYNYPICYQDLLVVYNKIYFSIFHFKICYYLWYLGELCPIISES